MLGRVPGKVVVILEAWITKKCIFKSVLVNIDMQICSTGSTIVSDMDTVSSVFLVRFRECRVFCVF